MLSRARANPSPDTATLGNQEPSSPFQPLEKVVTCRDANLRIPSSEADDLLTKLLQSALSWWSIKSMLSLRPNKKYIFCEFDSVSANLRVEALCESTRAPGTVASCEARVRHQAGKKKIEPGINCYSGQSGLSSHRPGTPKWVSRCYFYETFPG